MERPASPKRRYILSSFNPEIDVDKHLRPPVDDVHSTDDTPRNPEKTHKRRHRRDYDPDHDVRPKRRKRSERNSQDDRVATDAPEASNDALKPRAKKLRLKTETSKPHRLRRHRDDDDHDRRRRRHRSRSRDTAIDGIGDNESIADHSMTSDHKEKPRDRSRDREHSHISHRSRNHRRRHSRTRSPTPDHPYTEPALDPDSAFRESLFDALADDEGLAYWEGVYGQPLHIYANARNVPVENEKGELEQMNDEEYAQWVREQMWSKTHQGLLEEKERRRKVREAKRERTKEQERRRREDKKLEREVEQSLRAGEERRARREKLGLWQKYLSSWGTWDGSIERIPWPRGTRPTEGEEDAVRLFFVDALEDEDMSERSKQMKEERIRWHPDKIQQKLGGIVEPDLMRDVTMIFQVVDTLWMDAKKHK